MLQVSKVGFTMNLGKLEHQGPPLPAGFHSPGWGPLK